jgi:hypothetical protein
MKAKLHPAVKQLYKIIQTEDWSSFCPEKKREEELDRWVREWIVDVEFSQDVVSTNYLSSEYDDIIKYKLAQSMAEDIAEECTTFTTEKKKISASMCAIRRKEKVWGQG